MKPFQLSRDMVNIRGQFYPTGHILAMFPSEADASAAARDLRAAGLAEDAISLITPEVMLREVVGTVGHSDLLLPSAGTEDDTVRRYAEYASHGHHALLIHAPRSDENDRVMRVLNAHQVSHAQKYRALVIEDLA